MSKFKYVHIYTKYTLKSSIFQEGFSRFISIGKEN